MLSRGIDITNSLKSKLVMDKFIVFGLVYLFGFMITSIVISVNNVATEKDNGDKNLVTYAVWWPIVVIFKCIKSLVMGIKEL